MGRVAVIGIGFTPLSGAARKGLQASSAIMASERLFEVFRTYDEYEIVAPRVVVLNNVDETFRFMHEHLSKHPDATVALLAAGDPFFYGIGRRTIEEFGRDNVEVFPDLSCIQVAFARIRESWDDALLISFHGGPIAGRRRRLEYELKELPALIDRHRKLGVLTDKVNNPAVIAGALCDIPPSGMTVTVFVCERLGYGDEKITAASPETIAKGIFKVPNVVIIKAEKEGD